MMLGAGNSPTPFLNTIILRDDRQSQRSSLSRSPLPHL